MEFQLDGKTYRNYPDGREYDFQKFYDALRAGKTSTTSQVNYQTFADTFTPILESGRDILYLAFSSGLSGTYNGSTIAARDLMEKYPDAKILTVASVRPMRVSMRGYERPQAHSPGRKRVRSWVR